LISSLFVLPHFSLLCASNQVYCNNRKYIFITFKFCKRGTTSGTTSMEFSSGEGLTLDLLPNEAIMLIFKHLDSRALIQASFVCRNWNYLTSSEMLWKELCEKTERISGKFTKDWCDDFSSSKSWRHCFFWITQEDLKPYKDAQELCDTANKYDAEPLRKKYLFSRGLDVFPDSPVMLQYSADYLVDRPDINNSWSLAESFYKKALAVAERDVKHRKTLLFTIYRYSVFLSNNRRNFTDADKYYRMLLRKLPGNPWVFEKYAEFLSEWRHKYNLAEKIYRMILNMSPTGSALVSYALFLWQIRGNYALAGKCFRIACELDPNKVYSYVNFLGRQVKDLKLGKDILLQSKLYKQVSQNADDETKVFSLGLAFHQINCVDEAEELYRKHLTMQEKVNICTLSNLAELLLHARQNFAEAEKLYRQGLQLADGYNDTIEVALGSLMLASNQIETGLEYMFNLVKSSHIVASRNAYTEAWIIIYIHCKPEQKREALTVVKKMLLTELIRPKLILMFDANLAWAKLHNVPNIDWMRKIAEVYNCESEIEVLNDWSDWTSIEVPAHPPDDDEEADIATLLSLGVDNPEDEAQTEQDEQENND